MKRIDLKKIRAGMTHMRHTGSLFGYLFLCGICIPRGILNILLRIDVIGHRPLTITIFITYIMPLSSHMCPNAVCIRFVSIIIWRDGGL